MKNKLTLLLLSIILTFALIAQPVSVVSADSISVTGNVASSSFAVDSLAPFAASLAASGNPDLVAGIFAQDIFAAPIVQQPSTAPGYVSTAAESATQFGIAAQYGAIALLAHNYLLGQNFFSVPVGKILALVYGDGHAQTYQVTQILRYQALSPTSPYSDFLDLDDPNASIISVETLFYSVYAQAGKLILQTCIDANGNSSWGRLFIIAEPVEIAPEVPAHRLWLNPTQRIQ